MLFKNTLGSQKLSQKYVYIQMYLPSADNKHNNLYKSPPKGTIIIVQSTVLAPFRTVAIIIFSPYHKSVFL